MRKILYRFAKWLEKAACPHDWKKLEKQFGYSHKLRPDPYRDYSYFYSIEQCRICWKQKNKYITHICKTERFRTGYENKWNELYGQRWLDIPVEPPLRVKL